MTLRTRVAVAAAVGVLAVMLVVSGVLYVFFAGSLRRQVDGSLVYAAEQASTVAEALKRSAGVNGTKPFTEPVTVRGTDVEIMPGPAAAGEREQLGTLTARDVAVAQHRAPAYFATVTVGGSSYRTYTATMPGADDGTLVRTARAAGDGTLRDAGLLLAALTMGGSAAAFGIGRLAAGRLLRPVGNLTAAAEHVARTGDLGARLHAAGRDEVARLSAAFDTMLAQLEQSVAAQRRLVADASHELRTPLTGLTTSLDLLDDGRGVADPQAPQLVRAARAEAYRLGVLVNDLLDLARYAELPPHQEDTRLDLLAATAVERAAGRFPAVDLRCAGRPCLVHVDPAAVERAIGNLIDNAAKWSPDRGRVSVDACGGVLTVTDTGPGIDPADLPHIFERFYRAAAADRRPGSGLGLAIVAQVAEANGGTVSVHSDDRGSRFTLRFPLIG